MYIEFYSSYWYRNFFGQRSWNSRPTWLLLQPRPMGRVIEARECVLKTCALFIVCGLEIYTVLEIWIQLLHKWQRLEENEATSCCSLSHLCAITLTPAGLSEDMGLLPSAGQSWSTVQHQQEEKQFLKDRTSRNSDMKKRWAHLSTLWHSQSTAPSWVLTKASSTGHIFLLLTRSQRRIAEV